MGHEEGGRCPLVWFIVETQQSLLNMLYANSPRGLGQEVEGLQLGGSFRWCNAWRRVWLCSQAADGNAFSATDYCVMLGKLLWLSGPHSPYL